MNPPVEVIFAKKTSKLPTIFNSSMCQPAFYIQYKKKYIGLSSACRIPAETKNFSILRNTETVSGANLTSCLTGTGDLCPWDKMPLISI